MRLIGKLDSLEQARTFAEYLLSKNIPSSVDQDESGWDVWIVEEDHIETARAELEAFKQDPQAEKYKTGAVAGRKQLKVVQKQQRKQAARNIDVRQQWQPVHISQCPATLLLIGVSVLVALLSSNAIFDVGAKVDSGPIPLLRFLNVKQFNIDNPQTLSSWVFHSASHHEYWRYFTPMFIHFGLLHIIFNMMWMRDLGPLIESRTGSFLFLIIALAISLASNLAQFVISSYLTNFPMFNFGGMSGVVFGLFGFIWLRGKFDAASGLYMPPRLLVFLVIYQIICFLGILGPIANWAHLFGFISGAVIGGTISLITRAQRS
ncbi:MAG: rhomboid family intramembrane serine protease [Planctomycetaceae bacterium]|nr:rhomboid family intramembrane serine protease [Planctomycetaceae bacterium]